LVEREFPGSMHEGLLVITVVQVDPSRVSTGALETRGDLHSRATGTTKKSRDLIAWLLQTWLEGFQYLATFGASGWVRKLHLQPLRPIGQLPKPKHPYSLKRNFPFHWPFLDLLLSGLDLKGREFKE
jgi:hypothetical protein